MPTTHPQQRNRDLMGNPIRITTPERGEKACSTDSSTVGASVKGSKVKIVKDYYSHN